MHVRWLYPGSMPEPLAENVRAFLEGKRIGSICTVNRDGSPQATSLWYELRGDEIIMNTTNGNKKVRNLRRDPRAAFIVADHDPTRHVAIDGRVTLDESRVIEDLTELASRYAGPERGPGMAQAIQNRAPHITLRLSIDRVRTFGQI